MEAKKRIVEWFVEPLDAHTNEVVCRELRNMAETVECQFLEPVGGGQTVSAIQVPNHAFINRMKKSVSFSKLNFRVYTRRQKERMVRLWEVEGSEVQKRKRKSQG